jgi:hypothetical protein
MKTLYEVEYNEGKRLSSFVRHEDDKYIARRKDETFGIPEHFILTTLRHLIFLRNSGHLTRLIHEKAE